MIRNTRVTYLLLLTATAACQDRTSAPVAPRLSLNASAAASVREPFCTASTSDKTSAAP